MQTQIFSGSNLQGETIQYQVNKLSFDFTITGKLQLAKQQEPIVKHDIFYDQAHNSSIKHAEESMPFKQGGEIVLLAQTQVHEQPQAVSLIVKKQMQRYEKKLIVHGKRRWHKRLMMPFIDEEPITTQTINLCYENAFGGKDYAANPIGQGFISKSQAYHQQTIAAIEYQHDTIRHPQRQHAVAGFNAIARHWQPRISLYPQLNKQITLYKDMHNVAPLDQRFATRFKSEDDIILQGFCLADKKPSALLLTLPHINAQEWDTVIIDTHRMKLFLLNRQTLSRSF